MCEWADRVGALSDLQGGFREGRGTLDQIFILNEIVTSRTEASKPTFTTFIDVAKAYDTVWRPGLWRKLQLAGLDPQVLDMLRSMFRSVVRRVMIGANTSVEFEVPHGVPQGSVLSPFLYAAYINGLHAALRAKGLGVWVYGRLVPLLLYADDIILLSESPEGLSASLRVLDEYARKWRFTINLGKSNALVFGPPRVIDRFHHASWFLNGAKVPRAES